ncbi:DUF2357 domain-containing protein [Rhizobium leguminosarum]|uniref:DUF2357 domain-containing protein n=1 Tax=Rhizobium leguminosarum TaxID=384 RepID=UPI003F958A88
MLLSFTNNQSETVGQIKIVPNSDVVGSLQSLTALSGVEAAALGEPSIQLLEGCTYEYVVQGEGLQLKEIPLLIQKTRLREAFDRGVITTGLNVGTLHLTLQDGSGVSVGVASIEVRSRKLDYRIEYREMMDDIARWAVDLIGALTGVAEGKRELSADGDASTLQQKYFLLRSIIQGRHFRQAIAQILEAPHSKLTGIEEAADVRRGIKPRRKASIQIASARRRIEVPEGHRLLKRGITSLPHMMISDTSVASHDTPENRFVKRVLEVLRATLSGIKQLFEKIADLKSQMHLSVLSEMQEMINWLDSILKAELFRGVGRATAFTFSSPVLQRRAGYRELVRAWLAAQMASQLSWAGGELVFGAGQKNVATLYEYWCFLQVVEAVQQVADFPPNFAKSFIHEKGGGLEFMLARGTESNVTGVAEYFGRKLKLRVSFNETFRKRTKFEKSGSWSREMRPDVTLTLWPDHMTENDAEILGMVSRIHFDAKYKSKLSSFRSEPEDDGPTDTSVIYKRDDLAKMHAYRDAIRRSEAAYILYPGDAGDADCFQMYDEILPGLGAISLRPGDPQGLQLMVAKIRLLIENCCRRISQREYLSYARHHTKDVVGSSESTWLPDLVPTTSKRKATRSSRLDFQRVRHIFICEVEAGSGIEFDHEHKRLQVPLGQLVPEVFALGLKGMLVVIVHDNTKKVGYIEQIDIIGKDILLSVELYEAEQVVALIEKVAVKLGKSTTNISVVTL